MIGVMSVDARGVACPKCAGIDLLSVRCRQCGVPGDPHPAVLPGKPPVPTEKPADEELANDPFVKCKECGLNAGAILLALEHLEDMLGCVRSVTFGKSEVRAALNKVLDLLERKAE